MFFQRRIELEYSGSGDKRPVAAGQILEKQTFNAALTCVLGRTVVALATTVMPE